MKVKQPTPPEEIKPPIRSGDVQSIHRALDVVEAVGRSGEIGTSDLARNLGLAVSTVHSIIRTLAARGYLVRGTAGYRLGPGATVLASQWDPFSSLGPLLKPVLQRVAALTEHASTATMLVGDFARRVGFEPAPGLVTVNAGGDGLINPLTMATGRVLVAMTREGDWDAFVARGGEVEPNWSSARWQKELGEIAAAGVAVVIARGAREVVTAVGVPVFGPAGSVTCSMGCSMSGRPPIEELDRTLDALWSAASDLSSTIGGTMPRARPSIPRRFGD